MKKISAVIPAYNEENRIIDVICEVKNYVDEVLVIDDCSSDKTAEVAVRAGAIVITNKENKGYIKSIKVGFRKAKGDIIITLDADGEHNPAEIPNLIQPIIEGHADLVLGKRQKIPRLSERFLNWLTNRKLKIKDSGTGYRAIKKELALKLNLEGVCTCGVFTLESFVNGAKLAEVPIKIRFINKKRKIAWHHIAQFFHILRWIIRK